MKSALALMHLNMVHRFPAALSWVPRRRRGQAQGERRNELDTLVFAKSEAAFYAWLGQNVPAAERAQYEYLTQESLKEFRGRVLVISGASARKDAAELVEAVEPRVQCGMLKWAA